MTTTEERFWSKVNKQLGACWLWVAATDRDGYGVFRVSAGRMAAAHRYAYELAHGAVPQGLQLDHLCRVRSCVNPAHLEPVTSGENQRRSPIALATINAAKSACVSGHLFDEANTGRSATGRNQRWCRTCKREKRRAFVERRRAEITVP